MKRDPVFLTLEQRLLVVRLLVESLHRRNLEVAIACVTDVHFHIVARLPDHQLKVAKYIFEHRSEGGAVWFKNSVAAPEVAA